IDRTCTRIIGIVVTSVIDVLDHLSRAIEAVLSFQGRPVWMTRGPVRPHSPVLRRYKGHWPSRRIVCSLPVAVRPGNISGAIITGARALVVAAVAGPIVFVLHRPDPASPQRHIVPLVVAVSLAVRTVGLIERRGRSTMRFHSRVPFFQPCREI